LLNLKKNYKFVFILFSLLYALSILNALFPSSVQSCAPFSQPKLLIVELRKPSLSVATEQAELVVRVGKVVLGILAGEVMKGESHRGISKRGKVGAAVGGGGGGSGEEFIVGFLELSIDVTAEVGEAESAVGKMRKRDGREVRRGKVGVKEGGTSRAEQSALTAAVRLPGKRDFLVGGGEMSNVAGGIRDAMGSKEVGAGVRDNKGAGGNQSGESWDSSSFSTRFGRSGVNQRRPKQ
jgi:hypothetical protein